MDDPLGEDERVVMVDMPHTRKRSIDDREANFTRMAVLRLVLEGCRAGVNAADGSSVARERRPSGLRPRAWAVARVVRHPFMPEDLWEHRHGRCGP